MYSLSAAGRAGELRAILLQETLLRLRCADQEEPFAFVHHGIRGRVDPALGRGLQGYDAAPRLLHDLRLGERLAGEGSRDPGFTDVQTLGDHEHVRTAEI